MRDFETGLTQAYLKERLHYDPDTGVWTRLTGPKKGCAAGHVLSDGYVVVRLLLPGGAPRNVLSHRLAFLYMMGKWPSHVVDHVDRDKSNCAWINLRDVMPLPKCAE